MLSAQIAGETMIQFVLGRKKLSLASVISGQFFTDKCFSNERLEKQKITGVTINHSTFANMGFKEMKFSNCDFSFCVFIDCYFRKADFVNVNFTGCKFINCQFDVSLLSCNFMYVTFWNCFIEFDIMYSNLPPMEYSNIRWKLCTNLAMECLRQGNTEEYRKYFFEEKTSSESHFFAKFKQSTAFYKARYGRYDSIGGLIEYVLSKTNRYLWGYGEKIQTLFVVMSTILLSFMLFYNTRGLVFKELGQSKLQRLNLPESFYYSMCNFFTITSDFTTSDSIVRIATAVEGFLGMLMMGFFVAALFKYINRRQ